MFTANMNKNTIPIIYQANKASRLLKNNFIRIKLLSKSLILASNILFCISFCHSFGQASISPSDIKNNNTGLKTIDNNNEIMNFWLRNGKIIKGRINNISGDTVEIIDLYDKQNYYNKKYFVSASIPGVMSPSLGLGLGIPYGYMGINIDYPVFRSVYLTAGLGSVFKENSYMWNIGTNIYMINERFRPRISAYYGINTALKIVNSSTDKSYKQFTGVSLGGGFDARIFYRHGFDFNIFYIYSRSFDEAIKQAQQSMIKIEKQSSPVVFSIGYRFFY